MNIPLPQLRPVGPSIPSAPQRLQVLQLSWGRERDWEAYVNAHPHGTIFHTLGWRHAVHDAFGHSDVYLVAVRDDRIIGALPLFFVRTPLLGRLLISVPYAVGGGILADDAEVAHELYAEASRRAGDLRCAMIDFRSEHAVIPGVPSIDRYLGFERKLPTSVVEVAAWLPRKARAVIRNARDKYKLTCDFDPLVLPEVWELYCRNMRRLASINYPYDFFAALARQFAGRCWVSVVRKDQRAIAGLVTFVFRDRVLPYFFGCLEEARACGAANFVYACVMERAVSEGYAVFDFGRSRRDNSGSCDFKRFHGFEPRILAYQRCYLDSKKSIELSPSNPSFGLARRIWPHLPLNITRPAGALLSQYIPG